MPHALINGIQVYFEERGTGQPIVFCHELACDSRIWDYHFEALSARYRCIRFNHRGYPPSEVPDVADAYSQDLLVQDLVSLIDHLRLGPVHLVGVATGGSLALNLAIAKPQQVRSLVIVGTGAGSDDRERTVASAMNVVRAIRENGIAPFVQLINTGTQRAALKKKRPAVWERFIAQVSDLSPTGCANTIEHVMLRRKGIYEMEEGIARLSMPVLVVVGDQDLPAFEPSLFIARKAPYGALSVFPFTGHTVSLEEPEDLLEAVGKFLRQVDDGAWGDWRGDRSA